MQQRLGGPAHERERLVPRQRRRRRSARRGPRSRWRCGRRGRGGAPASSGSRPRSGARASSIQPIARPWRRGSAARSASGSRESRSMVRCCCSVSLISSVNRSTTSSQPLARVVGHVRGEQGGGHGLGVRGHEQRALVREVPVGRRPRDAGVLGGVLDRRGRAAASPARGPRRSVPAACAASAASARMTGRSLLTRCSWYWSVLHGTSSPITGDRSETRHDEFRNAAGDGPRGRRGSSGGGSTAAACTPGSPPRRRPRAPSCSSRTRWTQGKRTPLHTHPDADETMYVLRGRDRRAPRRRRGAHRAPAGSWSRRAASRTPSS